MRITSGNLKSRKLVALPMVKADSSYNTRPTSDRIRQAIFNILNHANWQFNDGSEFKLQESNVLDAFAGTGALGIEALSNNANHCCFLEFEKKAFKMCQENIQSFNLNDKSLVIQCDSLSVVSKPQSLDKRNLIFLDPPYGKNMIMPSLLGLSNNRWVSDNAIIVTEEEKSKSEEMPEKYKLITSKTYGKTLVRFFRK